MAIPCDVLLQWNATPEQLRTLGAALWRWCIPAGGAGAYRSLDSQTLADLIAGELPAPGPAPRRGERTGVRFRVWDDASPDRQAAIDRLRREIPAGGVEDILVEGTSWDQPAEAHAFVSGRGHGPGRLR